MERKNWQGKVKKAIIPAAGLGTRFLPATKAFPKEMVPIVDRPAIQYIVEEALAAGITEILVITSKGKSAMEDHFDQSPQLEAILKKRGNSELLEQMQSISQMADLYYIRQKEALGLGHAVLMGRTFAGGEPTAVLLPDEIILGKTPGIRQLIDVYARTDCPILGVREVPDEEVSHYGIVDGQRSDGGLYKVHGMIEKPSMEESPSHLAIIGRYVITPDLFDILEGLTAGRGDEIQLTDGLRILAQQRRMLALDIEGERFDVGTKLGFLQANLSLALKHDDLGPGLRDYLNQELGFHQG